MYRKIAVEIPKISGISRKKIKNIVYIYLQKDRRYNKDKKYTVPVSVCIGKQNPDNPEKMFPNDNYFEEFGATSESELFTSNRSSCLKAGNYVLIKSIAEKYGITTWLDTKFGKKNGGLIMDLASYLLISENNAAQHYPDYAYGHPLFSENMHIYTDSKVSELLLKTITRDDIIAFTEWWNKDAKSTDKVYVSYDSTNKKSQAGDIDIVEPGHPKEGENGEPVFNVAVAMDVKEKKPLFYEDYPGSIVDISQLTHMTDKAESLGYKHIGFILDRGYFDAPNISYMDTKGYSFIMMVKGRKKLVSSLVLKYAGTFESDRNNYIWEFGVNGKTIKSTLFAEDKTPRYIHLYYSPQRNLEERRKLELGIQRLAASLELLLGKDVTGEDLSKYEKYFNLTFKKTGKGNKTKKSLVMYKEKYEENGILTKLCGYFSIVSSDEMDAKKALRLYKSRDASEKLFSMDKTFMGSKSERVYHEDSVRSKLFLEFIALIVRSRMYSCLSMYKETTRQKKNFLNVVSLISELEKIELIRYKKARYHLDHAITARQKTLLSVFGMSDEDMTKACKELSEELAIIDSKPEEPHEELDNDSEDEVEEEI